MARFVGFKPEGMRKIASRMGYQGSMDDFDSYLQQNPEKKRQMIVYESMARQMAKGGVVKMQEGGATQPASPRQLPQADVPVGTAYTPTTGIGEVFTDRAQTPALPEGGTTIPVGTQVTQEQIIGGDTGQLAGTVAVPTTVAPTTTTQLQQAQDANLTAVQTASDAVDTALSATQAAQTTLEDPRAKVLAAQQTATSVGNVTAAQGQSTLLQNPSTKTNRTRRVNISFC